VVNLVGEGGHEGGDFGCDWRGCKQGWRHKFESGGSMHWKVKGSIKVNTLTFGKGGGA